MSNETASAIGPSTPVIIAEAGVNHNGDVARALDLVDASADAGADMVKFQAFTAVTLSSNAAPAAHYQSDRTGHAGQQDMLRNLELRADAFRRVSERCRKRGIEFLCTPFDVDMLDELIELGIPAIKVASGELTNRPALEVFGSKGLPVLLSTGMATLTEVREAIDTLRQSGATDITALHCTSLYPAPAETLNLQAIKTMHRDLNVPIGYSDHSQGTHLAVASAALGATVVEKHVTLDRDLPGPDHAASLEPDELAEMIRQIRDVVSALGNGIKQPAAAEAETAHVARRSWHASTALPVGHRIADGDVVPMRPEIGVPANRVIVGRALNRAVAAGEAVRTEDLQS